MNGGRDFEIPKFSVAQEIDTLDFIASKVKDGDSQYKKNLMEYTHAVYLVLKTVDDSVSKEQVLNNMAFDELTDLYLRIRMRNAKIYPCPHCKKKFSIMELVAEVIKPGRDKSFRKASNDTMEKKETG